MTAVPLYEARFQFARLFADCGRVLASAGLPLALGVLFLGAAPVTLASLPWWSGRVDAPTFRTIWVVVNTAKEVVYVVAFSVLGLFVTAVALKVLTGSDWRDAMRPRRLAAASVTALCTNAAVNWPVLLAPAISTSQAAGLMLQFAELLSYFVTLVCVGVALPVAVAEEAWLAPAWARSFRLLAGLRWRLASLGLAYLVASAICGGVLEAGLVALGLNYALPGLGRAAIYIPPVLLGALGHIATVSFFLQAQRIADGASAVELREIFA
jgi:hypothetical protein